MNVVIYAHYQPPQPSASATRMLSLARHLRSKGHSVTFLTSMPGPDEAEGFPIARVKGRAGLVHVEDGRGPVRVEAVAPAREQEAAGAVLDCR